MKVYNFTYKISLYFIYFILFYFISLILNLTRGMKRDESVNGQPQGQSFLFQDHVLEF